MQRIIYDSWWQKANNKEESVSVVKETKVVRG
jgi:hypothetical protein